MASNGQEQAGEAGTARTGSTSWSWWRWAPASCSASRARLRRRAQAARRAFIGLIRMMIAPIIFCTIVLGVGSVANAAQVGKVGGLALGYFLTMSTFALGIGLVVGNIVQPGRGLNLTERSRVPARRRSRSRVGTLDFILGIIPDTLVSALTVGRGPADAARGLVVGFALQAMGGPDSRSSPASVTCRARVPHPRDGHVGWPRSERSVRCRGRRRDGHRTRCEPGPR